MIDFTGSWRTRRYTGVDGTYEPVLLTITADGSDNLDGQFAVSGGMDARLFGALLGNFWTGTYVVGDRSEVGQFGFLLEENSTQLVGTWWRDGVQLTPLSNLWVGTRPTAAGGGGGTR